MSLTDNKGDSASHHIVKQYADVNGWVGRDDYVIDEQAVALVYNGISHAVMMVTGTDLHDFAVGFSVSEGIVDGVEQILDCDIVTNDLGTEVHLHILSGAFQRLKQRRRRLMGASGCGLCGIESLHALQRDLPHCRSVNSDEISLDVLCVALDNFSRQQVLRQRTGSAHAAALCAGNGEVLFIREDVGRHNAIDKLLGVYLSSDGSPGSFVLVSSRLSYEMVAKALYFNVPALVAVSGPTRAALDLASAQGLSLYGFASSGQCSRYV